MGTLKVLKKRDFQCTRLENHSFLLNLNPFMYKFYHAKVCKILCEYKEKCCRGSYMLLFQFDVSVAAE